MIGLRKRLATNRLSHITGREKRITFLVSLLCLAGLLLGGHLAAPTLMEPPLDLATPRGLHPEDLPKGAAALEAAFWLTTLLASVLNFRVLELLFRRPDIITLQTLPIAPRALFLDRLIASLTEALVVATAISVFFVPLTWHGGAAAALASYAMLLLGLSLGSLIALAVMLAATRQLIPPSKGQKPRGQSLDAYGGTGQILLYAPAASLGGIVVAALFLKLLIGEPLRLARLSEPFLIGITVLATIGLYSLRFAYKSFVAHYYEMAPRFHEADAAEFSSFIDYQDSNFLQKRRWELGLPERTGLVYRALSIDDDRRVAGARVGYFIVVTLAVLALMTLELSAMPSWVLATFPLILTAIVINPWKRIAARAQLLHHPIAMPIASKDRAIATSRAAIREYAYLALPYTLALALILGHFRGLGFDVAPLIAAAIFGGPGLAGLIGILLNTGIPQLTARWAPPLLGVLLIATAIASLPLFLGLSLGFTLVLGAQSLRKGRHHVQA